MAAFSGGAGDGDGVDPWATTPPTEVWQDFDAPPRPTVDATGKLILPLIVSQNTGPVTALDFGGRGWQRPDPEKALCETFNVETPAMCRGARQESKYIAIHEPVPRPTLVESVYYTDQRWQRGEAYRRTEDDIH